MTVHVPILLKPIVEGLIEPLRDLPEGGSPQTLVDCTLGGGGHTGAILEALASDPRLARHKLVSVDQDPEAIARATERFKEPIAAGRLELVHARFSEIVPKLEGRSVIGLMADLGFSSDQIEDLGRGLSFHGEGALDMRLDPTRGVSCREYLTRVGEEELADVIFELGEERLSRKIARAIVTERREHGIPKTPKALAELISRAYPPAMRHKSRIHPATRTFQALRIAVNDELGELDALLAHVISCVQVGGRVAILSFHSLEDRRVKQVFKERGGKFKQLTKKPIEPDDEEIERNPRSRSAKLRIAQRVSDSDNA